MLDKIPVIGTLNKRQIKCSKQRRTDIEVLLQDRQVSLLTKKYKSELFQIMILCIRTFPK